ncbi:MAG: hypothetical protein R2845_13090 [Thermomicrobiales bacterium]
MLHFPNRGFGSGFVLGLDQGQDALNTLTPARGGTITLLAALRADSLTATMPKLLGVAALKSPFLIIGIVLAAVISVGLPDQVPRRRRLRERGVGNSSAIIPSGPA